MRSATSLVLALGLIGSLAACTPASPEGSADCSATAAGSASNAVSVDGDFGSKPTVSIDTPAEPKSTERTVVIRGDGDTAVSGDVVTADFSLFNGESGDELDATGYSGVETVEFLIDEVQFLPGIVKTLECTQVGSRVVGVIPAVDAFGDAGSEQLGVAPGESIVFVVDLISIAEPPAAALDRADGEDQPAPDGFPTVVLDDDGRPTITIPDAAPPAELKVALLKEGDGETVAPGSDVVVHYVGINWNTDKVFDESWARGEPSTFNTGQVIAGFTAALEGQKVGSQVIVIIPPDQGYGPQGSGEDIGGTDTLVFVVDILGIA